MRNDAVLSEAKQECASEAAPSSGPTPTEDRSFLRMDDDTVEYMSLRQVQALMEPTCTRTSTAYILFYVRDADE